MKNIRKKILDQISEIGAEEIIIPSLFLAKIKLIILGEEVDKETDIYALAIEQLQSEVKKAWNNIKKSSQNNGSQQDMFENELNVIQARYSTKDVSGEIIIVPVMQMSKLQFLAKIDEHTKSGNGEHKHAYQLKELMDIIYP